MFWQSQKDRGGTKARAQYDDGSKMRLRRDTSPSHESSRPHSTGPTPKTTQRKNRSSAILQSSRVSSQPIDDHRIDAGIERKENS